MRRLSYLTLHLALGFTASLFMAAPVSAQDLGTYRPGQAYQSVTSPGADVCNSHCAGDAQCRAWNYVKVNPKAPGVCEFLASASAPVQSPISISGENVNQTSFARPVKQGGANTIRVGTSTQPKAAAPSVTQTAPKRRIVREAVPQRIQPQASANRRVQERRRRAAQPQSLTAQQNQYRRQSGDLQRPAAPKQVTAPRQQGPQRIGQPQPQFSQSQQPRQNPQFRPFLDSGGIDTTGRSVPVQNPQAYRGQNLQGQNQPAYKSQQRVPNGQQRIQRRRQVGARGPVGQPIGPVPRPANPNAQLRQPSQAFAPQGPSSVHLPRASAQAPVTQQNAQAAYARRQADLAVIASGNSADPIQQSLYGTLNDDVKTPAALQVLPNDPDAPIATSASRPVAPVQTQALSPAARGQLAGGPR